ncbi:MAG: carboxynorspermidine decarboxylase [Clostridiaceae bacterium]|nr:carboxynorspermidine decarboxylase [Clostridiaceae bacterium]
MTDAFEFTEKIRTPAYVVDPVALEKNLKCLADVSARSGARILLAQKAFSMFHLYPLIAKYLHGTTASGLYEARLGHERFGGETHIFSPAYTDENFSEIIKVSDHIVFNSFSQWITYRDKALSAGKSCGIRVNPECSTQDHAIYDPCSPFSRLGVTIDNFREDLLEGISGLHFHTLCEQNSDALESTLTAFESKFGRFIPQMKWINFGGGHHITRADYDVGKLIALIKSFKSKYAVEVYLEPGEAVALNAGYLVSTVVDVFENGMPIAILDTSAACHMPDVIEMPYRPNIIGAGSPGEKPYTFRLGGPTCLAGDIIGDYAFDSPLSPGDRLIFCDMAIYSMVKNNTFNGIPLPDIGVTDESGSYHLIRRFNYSDFESRLS